MAQTIIYLVCRPCDDSYYPGSAHYEFNPDTKKVSDHAVAFASLEDAQTYIGERNTADEESNAYEFNLYIVEVGVRPAKHEVSTFNSLEN